MALTFAEVNKYFNNPIISGVAQSIIDVNDIFLKLPLQPVAGSAITVNREATIAGATYNTVNTATPSGAKTDATVTPTNYTFVKAIGETTLDGLIEDTSLSGGVDAMAIQLDSKSKAIGRLHMDAMANGTVTNGLNSFKGLLGAGHDLDAATVTSGGAFTLDLLRAGVDSVLAKDGSVDFIMMSSANIRKYLTIMDSLGGTRPDFELTNPFTNERHSIISFEGIPIFRNSFMGGTEMATGVLANEANFSAGTKSSVYFGCFDDGSRLTGVSMVYPERTGNGGFKVKVVGELEGSDARLVRVVQYANLVSWNSQALTRIYNVA